MNQKPKPEKSLKIQQIELEIEVMTDAYEKTAYEKMKNDCLEGALAGKKNDYLQNKLNIMKFLLMEYKEKLYNAKKTDEISRT